MSWFDTTGLASFAKTALKEAQKQIDKALDIKDEDGNIITDPEKLKLSKTEPTTPSDKMRHSNSMPVALSSSVWGSFTGSFFENPTSDNHGEHPVTTPPTSLRKIDEITLKSSLSSESESLEILSTPTTPGSNITSPDEHGQTSVSTILGSESVEILGFETPTSEIYSSNNSSVVPSNINSPSSVEVIPEDFQNEESHKDGIDLDDDDDSISYNTVSDTITSVTIVEPTASDNKIITTPPSRSSLHLSLAGSFNLSNITEVSSDSTSTIVAAAAQSPTSCIISSASLVTKTNSLIDDAMTEKSSMESFDVTTHLSDSTQSFEDVHAANLLSISYNKDHNPPLNSSPPLSIDSKNSDIVKICSSQASGHNSGDELDTATSSDIEIISSPNGDSSSTNSAYRASPRTGMSSSLLAKSRGFEILGNISDDSSTKKCHSRELSDISIITDESSLCENDKLLRRICELQETLESREYKLLEMGRQNAELHEKYQDVLERGHLNSELTNVTEEYTQRLSALEKRFQQSIRERDHLRKQLDTAKSEIENRIEKDVFDKVVKEKEFMLTELRQEGESLSKQVLQHSNILKKLRSKEKENDINLKKQKEQIEEFSEEIERLKRSLSAKDEVERSQIEAVHKLSSEKRKLEKENYLYSSQLEDMTQKWETLQKSFDVLKLELNDKNVSYCEIMKKTEEIEKLENEKKIFHAQQEQLSKQIEEMREKLRQSDSGSSLREQKLRFENSDLLRRLEEAEIRSEEQGQAVSLATIPLIKQIESIQTTLNTRTCAWDKREHDLMEQLETLQKEFSKLNVVEQSSKEQVENLQFTVSSLEERLNHAMLKAEQSISLLLQKELEFDLKQRDYKKEIDNLKNLQDDLLNKLDANKFRIIELEEQLLASKENNQNERVISVDESSSPDTTRQEDAETLQGDEQRASMGSSPTQSLARMSICDSQGSNIWPLDDFDYLSAGTRQTGPESVYGSAAAISHAPILESLQAALKQRDGEVHQLQWELSRIQMERNYLTSEVSKLTSELQNIQEKYEEQKHIQEQFIELQQKYDAILQMYGEKVEETQELKLDLLDVKEMYKAQIDDLLRQQKILVASTGISLSLPVSASTSSNIN